MPASPHGNMLDLARITDKLTLGIGEDRAKQVVSECMREAKLFRLASGDDLQRLAERLIERGGFICIVGRSLMVDAIMMRRSDSPSQP